MYRSLFYIAKMDCPCEERLIRMKLDEAPTVHFLSFDLSKRSLAVVHSGDVAPIEEALKDLSLGAVWQQTEEVTFSNTKGKSDDLSPIEEKRQRNLLRTVLLINFSFFLLEVIAGWLSKSMGLVADSLDMLADALVYGMSLLAVGTSLKNKRNVAAFSGWLQIFLAVLGLFEVARRLFVTTFIPHSKTMMLTSLIALIANAICLYLLQRGKSEEAHIKASVIFSANDVIVNLGVIIAGLFVWWSGSRIPDLIVGLVVFFVVLGGAIRILKLARW